MAEETKPVPEKSNLKERLIAEADRILETEGLDALTLRAAARAAGVSHMAPYRHFEDKDALLAAVSAKGFAALAEAMGQAFTNTADPAHKAAAIGIAYVTFALKHPARYRLMFGPTITDKRRFPELVAAGDRSFGHCRAMVERRASEAERADTDLMDRRAIVVWSMVHGLASLLIDRSVALPGPDEMAVEEKIAAILAASS